MEANKETEKLLSPKRRSKGAERQKEEGGISGKDIAMFGAEMIPGVGEAMAVKRTSDALDEKDYLGAGIEATAGLLGIIPGVGDAAGRALRTTRKLKKADALGSRQISNVEYDNVFKKLDEVETPEEWQAAAKKLVTEERDITGQSVVRRTPELEQSARDLIDNKILTREQHLENVAKNKPITEWTDLPRQPSSKAAVFALKPTQRENGLFLLSKNDAKKLGVQQTTLKEGDIFNGRLDIPAYQNYDTWVVAGTSPAVKTADGKGVTTYAKAIHYTSGDGKPVKFIASKKTSEGIGKGEQPKTGYATISGRYKATSEEDLREQAAKLLNDPEWSQVGFDPRRLGTFYLRRGTDKHDVGSVITEADEVIQIGPLVLAKNVKVDPDYIGYNKGGVVPMDRQMSMFDDGGLMDEGGTVDPVSGNDVPPGSTQEEVRDDIPAQLSEGEFVFPADVVRYIGLGNLMRMRQEAKMGLKLMEQMGQMGNSEEATMPDDLPFDINDLDMEDEIDDNNELEMQVGGFVQPTQQQQQMGISGYQQAAAPTTGVAAVPQQAASQQYVQPVQPVQAAVPTMQAYKPEEVPTFQQTIGDDAFGTYDELRQYRNEAGNIINVPFRNGQPISPIPEGYTFVDPEETATEEVTTTPTTPQTTAVREEGGDDEARQRREEEMYGPGGGRLGVGDEIYGVSFDMPEGSMPGMAGAFGTSLGLVTGKPLPSDVNVNFKQGDLEFTVTGDEYNRLKTQIDEKGAKAESTKSVFNEILNASNKREAAKMQAEEEKRLEEARKAGSKALQERLIEQGKTAAEARRRDEERKQAIADLERRKAQERLNFHLAQEQSGAGSDPGGDFKSSGKAGAEKAAERLGTGMATGGKAKGGLMETPKPKTKKMKRGGLASKK